MPETPAVPGLVDHLFRHSSGRMVAALTRLLGPRHFDLAEEVVQEAMLRALQVWPFHGVPANPEGWLYHVARNAATDRLRRLARHDARIETAAAGDLDVWFRNTVAPGSPGDDAVDDELALIFMCCDPELGGDTQLAFTLKAVGGFSVDEIAAALLVSPGAVAQRIVRAKRLLRDRGAPFALPEDGSLARRLDVVLRVIYLLFNEGYSAHSGDSEVRNDLCAEAIRLARLLVRRDDTARPTTHALLALLLLQGARLPARSDESGAVLLLEHQRRDRWDRSALHDGFRHLELASDGDELSAYHLEAGIAACHAAAPSFADTPWARILELYDLLVERAPTPVVRLNRAVALRMVAGPAAALPVLEALEREGVLRRYTLLHATLGDFHSRLGDAERAAGYYRAAIALADTRAQRDFLSGRLAEVAP